MNTYTDQLINDFKTKYQLSGEDFWQLKVGGKQQWIIKHNAMERVALAEKMQWWLEVLSFAPDVVVKATVFQPSTGNKMESLGEASAKTTKQSFLYAMAEKRAVDRCVLKLLNAHAYLYTDADADEFKAEEKQKQTYREQMGQEK